MNARRQLGRSSPVEEATPWPTVDACLNAGLAETTSAKGRASLLRVREAVGELRRRRVRITVEAVGALCVELHGGPQAPSIRNSDRSVAIVRSAAGAQAAELVPPTPGRPREVQVLEQIHDPASRTMAQGWFAERRAFWDEICKLRAAARLAKAIAFVSDEMLAAGIERLEELVALVESARNDSVLAFDPEERAACRHFLEIGLAAVGMIIDDPSGEIVNHVSRTVAHAGVASALRKVAAADGS